MSEIVRKNDSSGLLDLLPAMPQARQTWHCFASPEKVADYLRGVPEHEHWCTDYLARRATELCGQQSFGEALDMVASGWQEGAARVARLRDKIVISLPVKRKLAEFHVAGALVDVPRYLAGEPKCMRRPSLRVNHARPVLTLVNHMGGKSRVPKECFINRCAVVAAIVDAIEANGYSCHVIGLSMAEQDSYLCGFVTTIKEPGDVPDLAKLAFALGHVSMFRRLVFGVRTSEVANRPLGDSLGSTCDFSMLDVLGTFVLPSMNTTYSSFTSEQEAETRGLETMLAALRAQDCPAFPHDEIAA
jgi:hypothetical protein